MNVNLTDNALEGFHNSGEDATVYLRDGGRLTGKVVDFDGYTVIFSGTPDRLVYRHAILKIMPAAELPAAAPKREFQKPRTARPQRDKTAKPRKSAARGAQPVPEAASGEPGFSNPMADAMQKWLKSQKGGG